jgi:hypothetical protein
MIGCLVFIPIAGFLAALSLYMGTLMAYFVTLSTAMGIYIGGLIAYFTAFFMWILS